MGEFDLIQQYFVQPTGVTLGIGDDCAILTPPDPHCHLASSTDLLIEGRHFFSTVDPYTLGHKALAVNLSDLAAMGATPAGCLLGIALPSIDQAWLTAFSQGFLALSQHFHCPLIGGDTTASPQDIMISVTVMGWVQAPFWGRDQAQVGDDIWLTGPLGEAHVALQILLGQADYPPSLLAPCQPKLEMPTPRLDLVSALRHHVHAVIDISDGLIQDLGHILTASHCGAELYWASLPYPDDLTSLPLTQQRECVLSGGEVYELCLTADPCERAYLEGLGCYRIGRVTAQDYLLDGQDVSRVKGFQHF